MKKTKLAMRLASISAAVMLIGFLTYYVVDNYRLRDALEANLSKEITQDMHSSYELYIEKYNRSPEGFMDLYESGCYMFTPDQFDLMVELGLNDSDNDLPVIDFLNERFVVVERRFEQYEGRLEYD